MATIIPFMCFCSLMISFIRWKTAKPDTLYFVEVGPAYVLTSKLGMCALSISFMILCFSCMMYLGGVYSVKKLLL